MLWPSQKPLKSNNRGRLQERPKADLQPTPRMLQCCPSDRTFAASARLLRSLRSRSRAKPTFSFDALQAQYSLVSAARSLARFRSLERGLG